MRRGAGRIMRVSCNVVDRFLLHGHAFEVPGERLGLVKILIAGR